jgi:hypothetical protein
MPRYMPDRELAEKEARVRGYDDRTVQIERELGWVARNPFTGAFCPLLLTNLAISKSK